VTRDWNAAHGHRLEGAKNPDRIRADNGMMNRIKLYPVNQVFIMFILSEIFFRREEPRPRNHT